jgi:hypothetical protein
VVVRNTRYGFPASVAEVGDVVEIEVEAEVAVTVEALAIPRK